MSTSSKDGKKINNLDPLDLLDIKSDLTEEESMVQDTVGRFVDDKILPMIQSSFEDHTFQSELIKEIADLGLLGSSIKGYDCAGLNSICYGLICQELERGDSGFRSFVSVQSSLVMYPIYTYGSEDQKNKWLPSLARGESIGCFGLTEPHGGSDPNNMKTHAKKDGDDWILNGSKMWITNGSIADICIAWAMTDEGVRGFIVEKGIKGLSTVIIEGKFSLRASVTGQIFLDDVFVSDDNVLPEVQSFNGPFSCLNMARYGIAWGSLGSAEFCWDASLDYSLNREQFGKPLAANQIIQNKLADMQTEITLGLQSVLRVGRLIDEGMMRPEMISLVKRNNCQKALNIARSARDIHGGNGISDEYHVIRHCMNLEAVNTYEGTETIHALILGKEQTGYSAF